MVTTTMRSRSSQVNPAASNRLLSQEERQLRVLDLTVELLIARSNIDDYWIDGFEDAKQLLAAVTFPSDDCLTATRHLQNAASYCRHEEFGAASFELRALRGQLHRL